MTIEYNKFQEINKHHQYLQRHIEINLKYYIRNEHHPKTTEIQQHVKI